MSKTAKDSIKRVLIKKVTEVETNNQSFDILDEILANLQLREMLEVALYKKSRPLNDRKSSCAADGYGGFTEEMCRMETKVKSEYRVCLAKGKKALFHRWADYAQIRDAILQGTTAGQLAQTFAIVEYEDGTISECYPNQVQFCDNLHAQFDWPEEIS